MIVKNDFLNHWKTKLLCKRLGDGPALRAVLSLWSYCELRRQWRFSLSPLELAGVCDFGGEPASLFAVLVELRFIIVSENDTWEVNGWGQQNAGIICKWPGRRLTDGEFYHPEGRIAKRHPGPIPPPSPLPIPSAITDGIGIAIPQAIGLDWIGEDRIGLDTPLAPQGGQGPKPSAGADSSSGSTTLDSGTEVPQQKKKKRGGGGLTEPVWPADLPEAYREPLARWFAFKRETGKAYKPQGWAALVSTQRRFPAATVAASVETSMANNWAGLFTERAAGRNATTAARTWTPSAPRNGSPTYTDRMNARDAAHDDELATLPKLPVRDVEPTYDWRSIAQEVYGFDGGEWSRLPQDNRNEIERIAKERGLVPA